ncbi:MAG: BppU family phage baseplate upper protein [Chloroflexota bacterium]|nr:BppU family phage baseplate upper protein [Chloroflexota bacterium]
MAAPSVVYFSGLNVAAPYTILDQDGKAVDLTGATVTCKLWRPDQSLSQPTVTVTNPSGGVVQITLTATVVTMAGSYSGRFYPVLPDGTDVGTDPRFSFVAVAE